MNRESTWRVALFVVGVWTLTAVVPGCSGDESNGGGGTGGAGGSAGGGVGGKASGGAGSGGKGSGGKGSGGKGSGGVPVEAGMDSGDGGCVAPDYLVYRSPGCDGTVKAQCLAPVANGDGGLSEACACDGTRILGGGGFLKPYRHLGECTDGSAPDSGKDAR